MSNHLTFVPSGTPVKSPSYTKALDYELELGFVWARPLFNATPEEALAAIGAFVVLNDFSARDVQRDEMQSGFGPQKSKHFLSSMSETAVTADALLPFVDDLSASIRINGQEIATTSFMGAPEGNVMIDAQALTGPAESDIEQRRRVTESSMTSSKSAARWY